jgi:3-oxoacyl-[acyl-carrier protein] reductase
MDLQLAGSVALVTAASKGLGKAAARALAREGAKVIMSSRGDLLQAAAEEIRAETGAEVIAIQGDVTSSDDISRVVTAGLDRFGRIDILIANAGGPPPGTFLALKPADWEAAFQLVVMSTVRLCYAVLPVMLEQGSGSIVATQGASVKGPSENLVLSNSLRMAVVGLMKTLADEVGPQGIRVNTINPGWTVTERIDQLLASRATANGTTPDQEMAKVTDAIPLKRMGTVEEYGRAIAWLASPAASYIHGHALQFDGGMTRSPL